MLQPIWDIQVEESPHEVPERSKLKGIHGKMWEGGGGEVR